MKAVAGKLKLDLAQYRDLAAFSQFESELDEETKKFLNRGAKVTQILKQKKNKPVSLAEQVAILWAASKAYLDQIPINQIDAFENKLLETLRLKGKKWLIKINKNKVMDEKDEKELEKLIKEI